MLKIKNLHGSADGKAILHGLDLEIRAGEFHVLMGPNGSGKSTLAATLMGHPKYKVSEGSVEFLGENLLELAPNERAVKGLFLAFQYPQEVPGVSLISFLRAIYNSVQKMRASQKGESFEPVPLYRFKKQIGDILKLVGLSSGFLTRNTNEGFSGGEKKKTEILQLALLEPRLAVLDEIDSGLDVDALKTIGQALADLRTPERSFLLITHNPRVLKYVQADHVHVMIEGRVVLSGEEELAHRLEREGFDFVREELGLKKTSPLTILQ
jgi:Fe-S cluster assembly ATP-binding protein